MGAGGHWAQWLIDQFHSPEQSWIHPWQRTRPGQDGPGHAAKMAAHKQTVIGER